MPELTKADQEFLKKAMRRFGINHLKVEFNPSTEKWPDVWCYPSENPPRIVVTREWQRQNASERHKRLVHECAHIGWGMEHGRKANGLVYSTYPDEDTWSKAMYERIK